MESDIGKILLSEGEILKRVQELGQQISGDYRGREITIICILKGAVVFLADLLRSLEVPADLDFVHISSYGDGTESTGMIEMLHCPTAEIEGRHVLVVDAIIDSGLTLSHLGDSLQKRRPLSLRFCVLLDKVGRRKESLTVDYVGFEIPDEFVVGYGLDYAGRYRGLRYIALLNSQSDV